MTDLYSPEVLWAVREIHEIRTLLRANGFDTGPERDHSTVELVRASLANLTRLRDLHHSTDVEPMDHTSRKALEARDYAQAQAARLEVRLAKCTCGAGGAL